MARLVRLSNLATFFSTSRFKSQFGFRGARLSRSCGAQSKAVKRDTQ